ncbi:MAG TPA: MFS transporter [Mycobacteriales bacterium]|nr:MFS transporter [Mycobacteriales bacterium]
MTPSALWRERDFRTLFVAATLSRLASEMFSVAIVLFVLARTQSAQLAGVTVAAATLPTIVTGPLMGAWLDRTRHRRTVFNANQLVLSAATFGLLAAVGHLSDLVVVLLAVVAGLPYPVRTGGFSGLIPTLVPAPLLPQAYGVEAASYNVAGIAGPALAGTIAGAVSPAWAVAATATMALVALVWLVRVPIGPVRHDAAAGRFSHALRDGLRLLTRVPELRSVTFATTVSQAWVGLIVVAFPLLAETLGHKRAAGGGLFSLFAVGALIGSVSWSRIAGRVRSEPAVLAGLLVFGAAMAGVGAAPSLVAALALVAVAGLIDGPVLAATLNLRQQLSPEHLRTQVFTTAASLKIGAFAVGSGVAGPVSGAVGSRGMLYLVAAGQVLSLLTGLLVRRSRH